MPTDLLLPAFVVTLLANAVLVAMAVRGLLRARSQRARHDQSNPARLEARPLAASASRAPRTTRPPIAEPAAPVAESPSPATPPDAEPAAPSEPAPAAPAPKRPRRPRSATTAPDAARKPRSRRRSDDGPSPRTEARRGGRRRFSLPPHDEDHDRINRSIETFLSGSDMVDTADAGPGLPTIATTVAIVAIDGLDADPAAADRESVDGVVATVERTLRGAARSADRVTPVGTGRFRVVLPATGELAARAYLRRVRATVAPSLEAADAPLGLVTATATVLDDTVSVAVARAEARLDAALSGAARRASGNEPRVAAD